MIGTSRRDVRTLQRGVQTLKENGNDQNRENIHDLDHGIDRRPGSVFVGIADGIAGNGRGVCE